MNSVPTPMQIQLARLFGQRSSELHKTERTPQQWKKTLKKLLDELFRYVESNIQSDELHWLMICSCFAAANEALETENFWPGYVEGITRLNFLLIGDYPDHRKYRCGKKKKGHYALNQHREILYVQRPAQKMKTLLAAQAVGYPQLSCNPRDALSKFREEHGFSKGYWEFFSWFKKRYPLDYAALF
jgi:hypothetical protein